MTVGLKKWPGKKMKLEKGAISEILAAAPTGNQMLRLAMLKVILRKKRNSSSSSSYRPQQKSNHRLQQVADYQPGDRLKEGTQIFILLSVQQKVEHEIVLPPSGSNSTQQLDTVILSGSIYPQRFQVPSGEEAEDSQDRPNTRLVVRPSVGAKYVLRLESHHNKHRPVKSSTHMRCCLCAPRSQRRGTAYKCNGCDVSLFNLPCFVEYHTEVNL
jgi:hypothetical protein